MARLKEETQEKNRINFEKIFKEKLSVKYPQVEFKDKYTNNHTKNKFYCKEHDNYFYSTTANVLSSKYCCPISRMNRTIYNAFDNKKYQERLSKINKYLILTSEYKNAMSEVEFKCLKCGTSGQKSNANSLIRGDSYCRICHGSRRPISGYNDIATTHPQYLVYFKNIEDAKNNMFGTSKKVEMKCPICNHERIFKINSLTNKGFSCPKCGDGFSYPNKFMMGLLLQLDIDFNREVKFEWSQNKIYDFVIGNTIIEMDGGFHKGSSFMSKEDAKANDDLKDYLAISNGYNIIRIDCMKSNFEYIKSNILDSKITEIINLKNVDWDELEKSLINENYVKKVAEIFNKNVGKINMSDMAKLANLNPSTFCTLLKKASKVGLSNYDARKSASGEYTVFKESYSKPVICLDTGIIYDSIDEAGHKNGLRAESIGRVCRGEKITVNGLRFDFVDTTEEIQLIKNKKEEVKRKPSHSAKMVLCNETNEIFNSAKEASLHFGYARGCVPNIIRLNRKLEGKYTFKYI